MIITSTDAATAGQDIIVNAVATISSANGSRRDTQCGRQRDHERHAGKCDTNCGEYRLRQRRSRRCRSVGFAGDVDAPLAVFSRWPILSVIRLTCTWIEKARPCPHADSSLRTRSECQSERRHVDSQYHGLGNSDTDARPRRESQRRVSFGAMAAGVQYNNIENVGTSPAGPSMLCSI